MPFLRAGEIKPKVIAKERKPEVKIDKDGQFLIVFPYEEKPSTENKKITLREKGIAFERFIGRLYEENSYEVYYNGIQKGAKDEGIDLICRYYQRKILRYTILIQCKNFTGTQVIKKDIQNFHCAVQHYIKTHFSREVIIAAFYTTASVHQSIFYTAQELGIILFDNCKM